MEQAFKMEHLVQVTNITDERQAFLPCIILTTLFLLTIR